MLNLDRLPAKNRNLARAWLNAHLLLAQLIDDMAQQLRDSSPPVHEVGQQRSASRWRCQKFIIIAALACLIDGIAQVFANPGPFAYRLFEPPRK